MRENPPKRVRVKVTLDEIWKKAIDLGFQAAKRDIREKNIQKEPFPDTFMDQEAGYYWRQGYLAALPLN